MENMNKYPNNTRTAWYIIVFMISMLILISLLTGCAITYDTAPYKCELMQRGEPCLSNHTCCKPPTTYYYYNTYPRDNWWYNIRKNTYTNYIIVKPNNKPTYNGHRPTWNNNKPNKKPKKSRK